MSHFYGNPLSCLLYTSYEDQSATQTLQPEHCEAVRMLPSFRNLIEGCLQNKMLDRSHRLIENDSDLSDEIQSTLQSTRNFITRLLRIIHVISSASIESMGKVELYKAVFGGKTGDLDFTRRIIDVLRQMSPEAVLGFLKQVKDSIESGSPELELEGWTHEATDFLAELSEAREQVMSLLEVSRTTGKPIQSSHTIQRKGIRTTVIAQRVQLSFEESSLSDQDKTFTTLVDKISESMIKFLSGENPQDFFLHEVWMCNDSQPYRDVLTPRPRYSIERALSSPQQYIRCDCCRLDQGVWTKQPPTASIYQLYLEAGSLINISDMWRAYLDMQNPDDHEDFDEREALVLFYRALAELKLLGMIKQSKKKADHLSKITYSGL